MIIKPLKNEAGDSRKSWAKLAYHCFHRLLFYTWFIYPLFLLLGLAFLGKQVVKIYQRGDQSVVRQDGMDLITDPNSEAGRAEFMRRFLKYSGDLEQWNQQVATADLYLSGWIRYLDNYRAFDGHKLGSELSVQFVDDTRSFVANVHQGELVPLPGHISPNEEPMAHALAYLLEDHGGKRLCHYATDAMRTASFEPVLWQSRDCLALDYFCEYSQAEVTLIFEQPEMILRERRNKYASGFELVYGFNDYEEVGPIRVARDVALKLGRGEPFQIRISNFRTTADGSDLSMAAARVVPK